MNPTKILAELQQYKSPNKEALLEKYITQRLNASLTTYYKELERTVSNLLNRDSIKLLKKLNEIDK